MLAVFYGNYSENQILYSVDTKSKTYILPAVEAALMIPDTCWTAVFRPRKLCTEQMFV